jgi:hypothetical protein
MYGVFIVDLVDVDNRIVVEVRIEIVIAQLDRCALLNLKPAKAQKERGRFLARAVTCGLKRGHFLRSNCTPLCIRL